MVYQDLKTRIPTRVPLHQFVRSTAATLSGLMSSGSLGDWGNVKIDEALRYSREPTHCIIDASNRLDQYVFDSGRPNTIRNRASGTGSVEEVHSKPSGESRWRLFAFVTSPDSLS